jgi:tRNA (mo5U34)-methyltransferase
MNPKTEYAPFWEHIENTALRDWIPFLQKQVDTAFSPDTNGHSTRWNRAWEQLPEIQPSSTNLNTGTIEIGKNQDITNETRDLLINNLKAFHPWRKGPFNFFGIHIETEWRSDWKWDRVLPHINNLQDGMILDVGCGSGYHCWRMLPHKPKLVMGIDPFLAFVWQYLVCQRYINSRDFAVLPIGIDDLPSTIDAFSTIFSMGVLYHRKDPISHIYHLKNLLRPGGQLVLETIIIQGGEQQILVPKGRYAKMRNVWFIPSIKAMILWLKKSGFKNVQMVNHNVTTIEEQKQTEWMTFDSLETFLDPNDPSKTVEGYPAPERAVFIAEKP